MASILITACGVILVIATVGVPSSVATSNNICDGSSRGAAPVKLLCGGIGKLHRGDIDGAISDFQQALVLQPSLSEAHLMLGVGYYDKKNYTRALVEYNRYLAVINNNYHAWSNRAAVFLKTGNLASARADIERALALKPHDPGLLWNRMVIAFAADDRQTVITDATWLLDHYPAKEKWLVMRGRALGAESRYTDSLADLKRALQLNPTATTYLYVGVSRFFLKQYESAVEDFARALAIDSKLDAAYLWRCRGQYRLQQFRAGLADCDEYVRRNPANYEGYYIRGILRSRARDQEGALADYHHAIGLARSVSERTNAWYGVGLADERAGRMKDARQAYERALQIDPANRQAEKALKRILR